MPFFNTESKETQIVKRKRINECLNKYNKFETKLRNEKIHYKYFKEQYRKILKELDVLKNEYHQLEYQQLIDLNRDTISSQVQLCESYSHDNSRSAEAPCGRRESTRPRRKDLCQSGPS